MIILGIETSCDETAAAVVTNDKERITILSNVVASSATLQAKYGGVIPEQAAREQIKSIIPVIEEGLQFTGYRLQGIDAIAVTQGPGLIGSLLVGVETAKVLATVWDKPLIPVNHLLGHFYANWIVPVHLRGKTRASASAHLGGVSMPAFPCLGLLVSGGHTDLVLFKDHGKYEYLGGTRDDAAGECFDKCARLLNLPYPGGPELAKLAKKGNPQAFNLPRPMMKDFSAKGGPASGWDFSFSGLKTAVANLIKENPFVIPSETRNLKIKKQESRDPSANRLRMTRGKVQGDNTLADLAASIEQAIVDVLVAKTLRAAQKYKVKQIMIAGGVAANQKLKDDLRFMINDLRLDTKLHIPPPQLCTDNAAMIAAAAFFNYHPVDPFNFQADPSLSLILHT